MKRNFFKAVFAMALLTAPAFAANAVHQASDSLTSAVKSASWDVFIGGGFIAGGGTALVGPAASAAFRVAELGRGWHLYIGGDTGTFFHFGPTYGLLPLLVKSYAKYKLTANVDFKAGLSLGAAIGMGSGASTGFVIWLEPGIDFWLNDGVALTLDPRFGGIDGATVFAPRVGFTFPF